MSKGALTNFALSMVDPFATAAPRCFRPNLLSLAIAFLAGSLTSFGDPAVPSIAPIDSFVRISDDEGLAHSDVRAIVQDHQGFIWFGLRLGGLTRYDGYELKVHQHDPANPRTIGNRVIWSLLVDRTGTLWIGTEGGLDRYDRATDTFVHYRHDRARPESIANNVVTCLFEDAAGNLWAGTREGLCRLDDRERGVFTTYRRPQLLAGSTTKDTIRSIIQDPATGLLWVGASDGLAAFDPRTGAFASFLHDPNDPDSLGRNAVNKVIRDETGVFWAFTEFGINSFKPSFDHIPQHSVQEPRTAFKRFLLRPGEATSPGINFVRDGLVDHKHRLWLATRGGLQLFDRATANVTPYVRKSSDPTSLSDDLTQAVYEDRSGNIWVGTYSGGASRLRSEAKPFRVHRHYPGDVNSLSEDRIAGLALDNAGALWAATVNGLDRFDGQKWTRYLHDPDDAGSLPSNDLSTVATAPNGDVWAGTNYGGLYRYDGHVFHSYPTSRSNLPMPDGWQAATGFQINSIFPIADGTVWLGARAYGVDRLSNGRFFHYNPRENSPGAAAQPTTNAIFGLVTADGNVWFATEVNGLVRLDPRTQQFTDFQPPTDTLGTAQSFHCIAAGADQTIWIGSADGLLKFDIRTERFVRQYTTAHGLPHAAVTTIVRDHRNHLWCGTANGLADFDPAHESFRVYDKPDGLPSNVFSQRAGALGPDGRVYLGTRAGIVDFMPEDLRDNPVPPPVLLTELRWIGRQPNAVTGSHTESVLNVANLLRVAPGQLGFTLKFAALDFSAPEKNRYRYRLEGWDAEWSSTNARERSATYTALPPGTYRFHVQASNADNVWNEQGASLAIIAEPYLWQTAWFRIALALAAIGVVVAALQWRLRSIRLRNAALEKQVSVRTAELREEVLVRQTAEAALRESHAKLEQRVQARTAELAQMNATLQAEIAERQYVESQLRQSQKMEAVGLLAGGVAHDFNNLLTVIIGQSEMLGEPTLVASERESALRDIKAAAQRAANLTRQLLVFSRHQPMNPVAIDLNQVVNDVTKLLRRVIGEHINLEVALDSERVGVLVDPGMLEQVIMNMAVNGRDAMPRGGTLMLSTARVTVERGKSRNAPPDAHGVFARCSVRDSGVGIPAEVLPHIFEPFFTTKETGKGTGLGLAISLGIVQQHQGWIDVESTPGKGTAFHAYLPLHSVAMAQPEAKPLAPMRVASNATILVAEDESAVRALVTNILTRQGYHVIEAVSGADALTQWAAHREAISVLLTDIVMPGGVDGHELAARLAKEKPALRVVTMSGYDPGEFVAAHPHRASGPHVRKPFSADDLLKALDSTVPRSTPR